MLKKFKHADIVVESDSNFDFAVGKFTQFLWALFIQNINSFYFSNYIDMTYEIYITKVGQSKLNDTHWHYFSIMIFYIQFKK